MQMAFQGSLLSSLKKAIIAMGHPTFFAGPMMMTMIEIHLHTSAEHGFLSIKSHRLSCFRILVFQGLSALMLQSIRVFQIFSQCLRLSQFS